MGATRTSTTTIHTDPITSAEYNALPERKAAYGAAALRRKERNILQSLIATYGLEDRFSIQAIYKQQPDLPADRIILYQAMQNGDTLCYTQRQRTARQHIRGLSFRILPDGGLGAYEYTAGSQPDLAPFQAFLTAFVTTANEMAVGNLFGLVMDRLRDNDRPSAVAGLVKFGFLDIYCPWPPNLVGYPDYDDWACCMSSRAAGR